MLAFGAQLWCNGEVQAPWKGQVWCSGWQCHLGSQTTETHEWGNIHKDSSHSHHLTTTEWETPSKNHCQNCLAKPSKCLELWEEKINNCCLKPLNVKIMHYATTDNQNTIIVVWVPVLHFIYLWKKKKKSTSTTRLLQAWNKQSSKESREVLVWG